VRSILRESESHVLVIYGVAMSEKITVFSLIYGDNFINRFFNLSLKTLIRNGDISALRSEGVEIEFLFVTHPEHKEALKKNISQSIVKGISRCMLIDSSFFSKKSENMKKTQGFKRMKQAHLLSYVIAYCLKYDRLAFNLVPDLLYSKGSLLNSYRLHKYTGKCVSFCNARLSPEVEKLDHEDLVDQEPKSLFFRFLSRDWLDVRENDPGKFGGTKFNFYIKYPEYFLLTPLGANPMMVKFKEEDLNMFLRNRTYSIWDDQWQEFLRKSSRLVAQNNLDLAMTVEVDKNTETYNDTIVAFDQLYREQVSEIAKNVGLDSRSFDQAGRSLLVDPIRHSLVFHGTAPSSEFY
jgi:hypothetical protein